MIIFICTSHDSPHKLQLAGILIAHGYVHLIYVCVCGGRLLHACINMVVSWDKQELAFMQTKLSLANHMYVRTWTMHLTYIAMIGCTVINCITHYMYV